MENGCLNELVFLSKRDRCNGESYQPGMFIYLLLLSVGQLVREKMALAADSSERQYGRHHIASPLQRARRHNIDQQ